MDRSLVVPGDYNITFNEHFYVLRLISSSFFIFLIIIILCIAAYIAYRYYRNLCKDWEIEDLQSELDKNLEKTMAKFSAIAAQFSDIELFINQSGNARYYFYKEIIPLMKRLMPHEEWIYLHCSSRDIRYWEKYKKELREQLIK